MVNYSKTKWVDHIVDQDKNIIQQGTPMSAGNFNKIESGIADAIIELNNNSEIIRDSIPSGLTKFSVLDLNYMKLNPGKFRMAGGTALVNCWKIDFPNDNWILDLPAPPTTGERDDLIFLEVWKSQSSDIAGEKVNCRTRIVPGVDFTQLSEGLGLTGGSNNWYSPAIAQGGNTSVPVVTTPLSNDSANKYSFWANSQRNTPHNFAVGDVGLYVAGMGDQASKDALKTADGLVYAIPLFRLKRRNSGGYSVINPNGAALKNQCVFNATVRLDGTISISPAYADFITKIKVGDMLDWYNTNNPSVPYGILTGGNNTLIVTSIDLTNNLINYTCMSGNNWNGGYFLAIRSIYLRQDRQLADTLDERDIIDLRHQVSLTGFNYQQLLEENFDKLLRGELQTKEKKKMIKSYHGINKTPVDQNTVFYASFDGTTVAEVGGALAISNPVFSPTPTGLGLQSKDVLSIPLAELSTATLDCFMETKVLQNNSNMGDGSTIIGFTLTNSDSWKNSGVYIGKSASSKPNSFYVLNGETGFSFSAETVAVNDFTHIRLVANLITKRIIVYINGVKVLDTPCTFKDNQRINALRMGNNKPYIYSDVSVSNIDRGNTFATLPADFLAGYSKITRGFNGQRKTYSDALTSQYTIGIAKGAGSGHSKGLTVTQATAGKWTTGDTIKIKGLAGEIISGVIDTDTALARILGNGVTNPTTQIIVDDISKLSINDTLYLMKVDGTVSGPITITAIDTTNKIVTSSNSFTSALITDGWLYLIETTTSNSVPLIKFMNAGTLSAVGATWTGLGTNEATCTLGTNATLVNADLQLEYSLNSLPGQGGISEVYTSTIAGEYKGKKLIPGTVAIRDDLKGKTVGDSNPITVKYLKANTPQLPVAFTQEVNNVDYSNMATQGDGLIYSLSTSINGEIPQALIAIDLVKEVEAKYGTIPSIDKVGWLKSNLYKIATSFNVSGTVPNGTKVCISEWNTNSQKYGFQIGYGQTNLTSTLAVLTNVQSTSDPNVWGIYIDNGFIYYLVNTDPSNGATPSSITIDSISVEIALKGVAGYDMLVPENPRRDDNANMVLLVRKETKEIVTYFDAVNTDGIITYGDYVPYQGVGIKPLVTDEIYPMKAFIHTDGTAGPYTTNTLGTPSSSMLRGVLPTTVPDSNVVPTTFKVAGYLRDQFAKLGEFGILRTNYVEYLNNLITLTDRSTTIRGTLGGTYANEVIQVMKPDDIKNYWTGLYLLGVKNGEIYLIVCTLYNSDNFVNNYAWDTFRLKSRPIIR